jgi:plasmid stability protein
VGELRIRDVDDDIVVELKRQAKRHGRTLGEELRELLSEQVRRPRREIADRLSALTESIREKHGTLPDSTTLIRQMRDERG